MLYIFIINLDPSNAEDAISLSAELIYAGVLISHAGESDDWRLGIIDVNYPGNSESCGVSVYENDLARISQSQVNVYDVMESFVCDLNDTTPLTLPEINTLLCKDTSNMIGSTVECLVPRAYCSYQPTSSGEPTFCNDSPYPNNSCYEVPRRGMHSAQTRVAWPMLQNRHLHQVSLIR